MAQISRGVIFVVYLAVFLRFLVFLFGIHEWIYSKIEFTTPITSWKRVLEGLALLDHGISPYSGDSVHEPPLILLLFHLLQNAKSNFLIPGIFLIFDVLTGIILYKSAQAHCKILARFCSLIFTTLYFGNLLLIYYPCCILQISCQEQNIKNYAEDVVSILLTPDHLNNIPLLVLASYLLNPFTIATCVAQSTSVITNLSVTLALYFALLESSSLSMCFISFAAYKTLYPIMLVVPLAFILMGKESDGYNRGTAVSNNSLLCVLSIVMWMMFWCAMYLGLSWCLVGSWEFIDATYGFILRVPDLTPNMGLFWYFFLEMFDHFREFFILVFQLNAFFYVIPLSSLLRNDAVFLFYTLSSVIAIFKSYPTFGDFSIPFALLISWSHLYPYMKNVFVVGCMFVFSSVLAPLFWYLWIYAGSANANFFYAATLAYSSAQIFLLGDVILAFLRRNFDLKYGIARKLVEDKRMTVILK